MGRKEPAGDADVACGGERAASEGAGGASPELVERPLDAPSDARGTRGGGARGCRGQERLRHKTQHPVVPAKWLCEHMNSHKKLE